MSEPDHTKVVRQYVLTALAKGTPQGLQAAADFVGVAVPDYGNARSAREALHDYLRRSDPEQSFRELNMRQGGTIDDHGTSYLWRRRLVCGAINVVFSRPGRGKSTLAANLAGHVTQGAAWPDGSPCDLGDVVYVRGEGTDAAIRDRMSQAGANPSRYYVVGRASDQHGEASMVDLAVDTHLLARELNRLPDVRLVIIDTLDSLYPSMRAIDNANIRKCLWPLQELAEQRGLCVVVFAHTNKGGYADPLDRLSGGRAIGGAARCIWYLGKLDPQADECFFAMVKANDFRPAPTLAYQIVGVNPNQPGAIRWGNEREDVTAWELDRPPQAGQSGGKAEEATAWLRELLAGGPVETSEVARQAEQVGYGRRVMSKAKGELGAESRAAKGTRPTRWYLCLPGQQPPDLTEDAELKVTHSL